MTKKIIRTTEAPAPVGPYNQAIAVRGTTIYVAGQIPLHPQTAEVVGVGDIALQTQQVMDNIGAILKAAGANYEDIVKTTVYLSNLDNFIPMNRVYAQFFTPATAPTRACVEVSRLPKDVLVEIECLAVVEDIPVVS
ncbi:MAG: Rid family detoxifying hydrolase [Prochloraceae cyanobacterium]